MYFTYNNIYSPYNNNDDDDDDDDDDGILVVFYVSGIFWSFLGFGECFSCYNLLINTNIINTSNYVNIF